MHTSSSRLKHTGERQVEALSYIKKEVEPPIIVPFFTIALTTPHTLR